MDDPIDKTIENVCCQIGILTGNDPVKESKIAGIFTETVTITANTF